MKKLRFHKRGFFLLAKIFLFPERESCLQRCGRFGTYPIPTQGGGEKCSGPLAYLPQTA